MTKKICNDVVGNMYKSITGCVISYQDIYCVDILWKFN